MATMKELNYGFVEIYNEETLGVGSYGKVCQAKCGQLPCAAKLLHDTLLGNSDPGVHQFEQKFEQECRFLRVIKHPNIVQYLGISRDPQSGRLGLLMELMDESLTRFLERSTGPLPYHIQLNIGQDVALALAYLHSNDIVHRDLSSNNVLLIGEGTRAKVTDFGMSTLIGMNPRLTPLTQVPGTAAYMPPEALITPPHYSSKLDCFSHGVLTIQIATRQFPNPGDAQTTILDRRYPTGRVVIFVPEMERRKKDIDQVESDHPLLPLALNCLKDRDTERPSADELCGRLASLKHEPKYTHSVEQSRQQNTSLQTLQQQLQEKDAELARARTNHETEINECHAKLQSLYLKQKDGDHELVKTRANHRLELNEYQAKLETLQQQICKKDIELAKIKEFTMEHAVSHCVAEIRAKMNAYEGVIEQLREENRQLLLGKKQEQELNAVPSENVTAKLEWRQGEPAPVTMTSYRGAAVVHHNTAYFSQGCWIYAYSISEDKWSRLKSSDREDFGMVVVGDKLTTVGGRHGGMATNTLLCLSRKNSPEMKWEGLLPPMPTERVRPAAVTTPTHLVVAGGRTKLFGDGLSTVEVLNLQTLQWGAASSSPSELQCPDMTLCSGQLYLTEVQDSTTFSCSAEELVKSCNPSSAKSSDHGPVWTKITADSVPNKTSLAAQDGRVLAVGGIHGISSSRTKITGAIHCYNGGTDTWSAVGEMPTPRYAALVAVLPSQELVVVGGWERKPGSKAISQCKVTEIAHP